MIILNTSRQFAKVGKDYFFTYINQYKKTRVNNVAYNGRTSEEYLSALVINCLLTEVETLFDKKLVNTIGKKIKFQFSDAEGIVLYRALLALPLPADQIYFQLIRNEWVQLLDQQLMQKEFFSFNSLKESTATET